MAMMVVQTSLFKKCGKPQNWLATRMVGLGKLVKLGFQRLATKTGDIMYNHLYLYIFFDPKVYTHHMTSKWLRIYLSKRTYMAMLLCCMNRVVAR